MLIELMEMFFSIDWLHHCTLYCKNVSISLNMSQAKVIAEFIADCYFLSLHPLLVCSFFSFFISPYIIIGFSGLFVVIH